MTPLEKEIWSKIRSGDHKAFEYVFKSYYSMLCTYAFEFLKNEDYAEEIVQETLIHIWENRKNLTINISLKSYLYRSIHNQCINSLKHSKVIKNLFTRYEEETRLYYELILTYDEEQQTDQYFYDGLEDDLEKAIDSLPDQCRTIFMMSRFESLHYDDIATRLNISVNTVKTQIRRAVEKLRSVIFRKISSRADNSDI